MDTLLQSGISRVLKGIRSGGAIAVLYLAPVLALIGFVACFNVNVPFYDGFALVRILDGIRLGTLTLQDLVALHNEHRLLFPNLINASLVSIVGWNIPAQLGLSISFATLSFVSLCWVSSRTHADRPVGHWGNIAMGVLLFSFIQYENWLWGFQTAWFWIVTCFVLAIALLCHRRSPKTLDRHFFLAALFCGFASFSSAHGLLTWLALTPWIFLGTGQRGIAKVAGAVWCSLTSLVFTLYLYGYRSPPDSIDRTYALTHPLEAVFSFLAVMGNGLFYANPSMAIICGFVMIVGFISSCVWFYRVPRDRPSLAPWLSLGLFVIGFCLLTAIGRTSLGLNALGASRYTTITVLMLISLVQLGSLYLSQKRWRLHRILAIALIMISLTASWGKAIPHAAVGQERRQTGQACLILIDYMETERNACLTHIFPDISMLKGWFVQYLEQGEGYEFERDMGFLENPSEFYGQIDPRDGDFVMDVTGEDKAIFFGWAVWPGQSSSPDWVFFSRGDSRRFFAAAPVNQSSPDVAEYFQVAGYSQARWLAQFSTDLLTAPETTVWAWAYDPDQKQFIRLNHSMTLRRGGEIGGE